ncbi:MAG: hypothetical protein WCA10_10190 [Terracidiphilus sp.]
MARRKGQNSAFGILILLAVIVWAFLAIRDSVGFVFPIAVIVGIIVLIVLHSKQKQKKRIEFLTSKYGDPTIVDHIFNHRYWQGQTAEQLMDSLGNPHGVDRKLLKTLKREVWKYNPRGVNRYALRITLDNDVVSNWDHKQ